ncbi:lipid transporter family ABC domain protein (macronuclear) [Tetrahymena thermophila SB210]|uniref:Lipid transporter family ABC domain protein n=1 Tax=Tetrahymena thermophila (strain SB210) TaxID=312017 RepID=Q22MI0_TETTS|nr:lipid transporter family ABC domain protein [Tetrahymena thermophila SB210]EAR86586.2 lipid transporter family ABC domain protein [Tetrahymena thermophila SB210]|eukprot:XP_977040.2 lipid transporter family ABC domain protein [Tetrahymena thermophila SB210]
MSQKTKQPLLQKEKSSKMTEIDIHNVDITFKNLNYNLLINKKEQQNKLILNNVSGLMKSGEITAILGPSGGGKTSLLNILAAKIKTQAGRCSIQGDIRANGFSYDNQDFNSFSSYVMQNDILLGFLTVKEAIQFAANLKMNGTLLEKDLKVQEVISALKLQNCQNTLIGNEIVKGVSGGERKRVNIACEIINDPQVLFLDEPTSGLDSYTAYIVLKLLKDYAQLKSMNVIMSIHSPNQDLWDLFDQIILMAQGRFVYQGRKSKMQGYFESLGYFCPIHMCQPDYYLSLISQNGDEYSPQDENKVTAIKTLFNSYDQKIQNEVLSQINQTQVFREMHVQKVKNSLFFQTKQIASRNLIKIFRDPLLIKSRILQTIAMSLIFGLIYLNQPKISSDLSIRRINDRNGIMFMDMMNNFMNAMMGIIISFPSERLVFLKEENCKMYTPISYFLGKFITEFLMNLLLPLLYSSIIYYMVGYSTQEESQFWIYVATLVLLSFCGSGVGLTIGVMFQDVRTSTAITPAFVLPLILFCGMFKQRTDYASWIGWIQYISPFSYAFECLIRNEYKFLESPYNPIQTFQYTLGMDTCFLILAFMSLIFQLISILMLYLKRGVIQ